eukprot:TRINITY_DN11411_c0_g6_i1.p1 TRINITY_DN11411_c0_g6~~TRINITY_DN11411_c0_g6_i1.p1  ORF type:complete len:561 (+),score=43.81 TRINITY_DN11411_c0_g6_i1:89-1771(+)
MVPTSKKFVIGEPVELYGLESAKHLNGKCGRVVAFHEDNVRYGIKVEGIRENKSVKPANLRMLNCEPMPAVFLELTLGTPIFKVLLHFLSAETLVAFAGTRADLRREVNGADKVWERLLVKTFGGDLDCAQRRCAKSGSTYKAFTDLSEVQRALDSVEVIRGNLTHARNLNVQAIVCPAVQHLRPYGPAAQAVYAEAGPELMDHLEEAVTAPLEVGEVYRSPGFGLGVDSLIHAVGPTQNTPHADRKLRQVYRAALSCVKERGNTSVAFGSISTGGNGFAPQLAAMIAVEEIRDCFLKEWSPECKTSEKLRIVIVAFDNDIQLAFKSAIGKMKKRMNEQLVEELPLIVLDSVVPRQRCRFRVDQVPVALHADMDRFAMVGLHRNRNASILSAGVEVRVASRSSNEGLLWLEVIGGRRFTLPGSPTFEELDSPEGGQYVWASVEWSRDDDEAEVTPADIDASAQLDGLVDTWIQLVRHGHERQPGQVDLILDHMGPMPPVQHVSDRALWVVGLINPLPGLGVAWEIRPAALLAASTRERLRVATDGIRTSIAHLDGSRPIR